MTTAATADIKTLFDAGAHVGYARTRRHPTSAPFLYSTKDRTDIFNLEETAKRLEKATEFAASLAAAGKQIVFVGGKHEAQEAVKAAVSPAFRTSPDAGSVARSRTSKSSASASTASKN